MLQILASLGVVSDQQLKLFCFSKKVYKSFHIYQKNWKARKVFTPIKKLKQVQTNILWSILYPHIDIIESECVGFVPNKSIIDNASPHVWKSKIINIDIKDFFPSITRQQVYKVFKYSLNYDPKESYYLSKITTHKDILPQWSPSSPMLANFVATNLDKRIKVFLSSLETRNWFSYSRYADDITIWFSDDVNMHWLLGNIYSIIDSEWFVPNYNKTRILTHQFRMEVTGLVVNGSKPTVGRVKLKKYRAIFHSIEKFGWKKSLNIWNMKNGSYLDLDSYKAHLKWWLSFIKLLHPSYYEKYILLFNQW